MGIFDRFRRKHDTLDLGELKDLGEEKTDLGLSQSPLTDEETQPQRPEPTFRPAFSQPQEPSQSSSDMQLIQTKLDLINQRLENIDRRLQIIEQLAKEGK